MCDPMSLVMGALSAGASVMSANVQAKAVKQQEAANNQWMQFQNQQRHMEAARQEELRQQAESHRQATVQDLSPENQEKARSEEEARLTSVLGGAEPDPSSTSAPQAEINAALLSGQSQGGKEFMADMASRVSKATQDARARIRALAGIQSYGGTIGGLQTRNALELTEGEQGINLANNLRQGSMGAYSAMQAIEPRQFKTVSNPWGGVANSLAGMVGKFGKA